MDGANTHIESVQPHTSFSSPSSQAMVWGKRCAQAWWANGVRKRGLHSQ